MAIHDARILQLSELLAGDIIIEYEDSPEHSMLWVGGDKPLVHSADSGTTSGIVQQSARGFGEGDTPFAEVYRCRNQHLAHKVSDIAQRFAVVTTDPRYVTAKKNGWNVGLKTRFSQNRLGGNGGVWGPEAIVRAVRAYYRALKTSVLSPSEGVTCSQFVTYTFQAASIEILATRHRPTKLAIEHAAESGLLGQLRIHDVAPLQGVAAVGPAYSALRSIRNGIEMAVPYEMKVNASITSVDVLTDRLRSNQNFTHVGNLTVDDD